MFRPEYIVIHHTVSDRSTMTLAYLKNLCAYHKLITPTAVIVSVPENRHAAHIFRANSMGLGMSLVGNYDEEPLLDSTLNHLAFEIASYAFRRRWSVDSLDWRVCSHKFFGASISPIKYGTACPGKYVLARFPEILSKSKKSLNDTYAKI